MTGFNGTGWFEIGTDDPAAAERFYGEVFGWTLSHDATKSTDPAYRIFTTGDAEGLQVHRIRARRGRPGKPRLPGVPVQGAASRVDVGDTHLPSRAQPRSEGPRRLGLVEHGRKGNRVCASVTTRRNGAR